MRNSVVRDQTVRAYIHITYGDPPEKHEPLVSRLSRSLEPTRINRLPMTSC